MTRSVYIIGSAGVGKSTFTADLLAGRTFGPLEVIHDSKMGSSRRPNPMHGQYLSGGGLYLGVNRPVHPGSDGLSRTCGTSGMAWLALDDLPRWIVSEGSTLATRGFLGALQERTDLLLVYLTAAPDVIAARIAERGSTQASKFVQATATRSAGLAQYMTDRGAQVLRLDAGDPWEWDLGQDLARTYLQ